MGETISERYRKALPGSWARWERARYGEFRVDAAGRALLVGLRGPALQPL